MDERWIVVCWTCQACLPDSCTSFHTYEEVYQTKEQHRQEHGYSTHDLMGIEVSEPRERRVMAERRYGSQIYLGEIERRGDIWSDRRVPSTTT